MQSGKQGAHPVINALGLWQLRQLDTYVTAYHVHKCPSFHKGIVVITGRGIFL